MATRTESVQTLFALWPRIVHGAIDLEVVNSMNLAVLTHRHERRCVQHTKVCERGQTTVTPVNACLCLRVLTYVDRKAYRRTVVDASARVGVGESEISAKAMTATLRRRRRKKKVG